ncbi:hypothetical protein DJ568_09590 [Mucilaginibacter hurinus]|uniref:Carboxypeptidase-like regulatory domain-containing protein n=1 Tax=Mucilaginibacter hurinus TaxID=2201324 RepID=A0A367GPV8_9SPHI|nr:carboxypeptidase-like regulatory domain-containing protein [Mucilaginibacter hurinus]RCH54733.1 hypothetical protein DJ568_09590 [Mucilaginibacter hurinus]
MSRLLQKVSFSPIMKLWLLLLSCAVTNAFAQEKSVEGIVFDKDSKTRLASIRVLNTSTNQSVYNNLKGEFKINASKGDALVFTKEGYRTDTIKVDDERTLAVYLKSSGIQLQQVDINDTLLTPEKRLLAIKRDYSKIYGSLAHNDLLSLSPGSGAGFSLDALYNAFSRSGRNAEKLQQIIERDYQQNVIDYRFNRTLVNSVTGLTDKKLTDFMEKYRPSYYFVTTASDYEFIRFVRNNFKRYKRSPRTFTLQPLIP